MKQLIIKIILSIVIIVLAFLVIRSIQTPLKFKRFKKEREAEVIQNLKDIRASQIIYKLLNKEYASNLDTLIDFIKTGEISVVKIIPDPDDTTFTLTLNDTLGYIGVGDSLFKGRPGFVIDSLKYVPFSGGGLFELDAGRIKSGGLKVYVYEVSTTYKQFLKGLDNQLVINLIKSKEDLDLFPGLKVGSMVEASTNGNWE